MFLVRSGRSAAIVIPRYHGGGWAQARRAPGDGAGATPARTWAHRRCGRPHRQLASRPRPATRRPGREPAQLLQPLAGAGEANPEPIDLTKPATLDGPRQPRLGGAAGAATTGTATASRCPTPRWRSLPVG